MTENYLTNPGNGWFVARMGPWEWLETLLKSVAIAGALWGLSTALADGFRLSLDGRLPQIMLLGLASLGTLAAVVERLATREVISMVFVLLNNVGHWGMTAAFVGAPDHSAPVLVYCSAMLAGDVVKLYFFWRTGFTVRNAPRSAVLGITGLFALAYLTVLLLEIL